MERMTSILPAAVRQPAGRRSLVVSVGLHGLLGIGLLQMLRMAPHAPLDPPEDIRLIYPAPRASTSQPAQAPASQSGRAKASVSSPARLSIPDVSIEIPNTPIAVADPGNMGKDIQSLPLDVGDGGTGNHIGGNGPGNTATQGSGDGILNALEVDKAATAVPGNPTPHYPEMLRSAGIEDLVQTEFVVDTTGRADPHTLRILNQPRAEFIASVIRVLPHMHFYPAEFQGRRVAQRVRQDFAFTIRP